MDSSNVSRRAFLESSTGIAAGLFLAHPAPAQVDARLKPAGVLYGRAGKRGIPAASSAEPARGDVVLLDRTTIVTTHHGRHGIGPGKSVLLSPDGDGGWFVLYAEV
jgi:hypothetical protein